MSKKMFTFHVLTLARLVIKLCHNTSQDFGNNFVSCVPNSKILHDFECLFKPHLFS